MQKCKNITRNYVKKGSTVVVSCSGGPDSMCLLKNILDLRDELNLNVVVGHINHNVRNESDFEEQMVRDYCLENNVVFESMKITNYSKENFHNEARIIRYDFMKKLIKKYKATYLFTAHHGDDLMETIFMRIARGSNLKGYSGFKLINEYDDYTLIRPLLYETKDSIIKYNDDNNLNYALDSTNYLDDYTRNRYRNHILPFLKAENENIHLKYIEYSSRLLEADEFISKIVKEYESKVIVDNKLLLDKFNDLDELIKIRIIEDMLYKVYKDDLYIIDRKHIELILNLTQKNGNHKINLPNGFVVHKVYNNLFIMGDNIVKSYNYELQNEVIIDGYGKVYITNEIGNSNYYLKLKKSEVEFPLFVRSRRDGDCIEVKNLNGSQKLKKIFIDKKISPLRRDEWPIVCDASGKILWVLGLKKSKFDKENDEMYDIILKYEEEDYE